MERITNLAEYSINNFFTHLFKTGTTSNTKRDNVLILTFLEEMLATDINYFIDEDDYNHIIGAINCLAGNSCAIPFMTYESYDTLMHKVNVDKEFRRKEDGVLRFTEIDNIRLEG